MIENIKSQVSEEVVRYQARTTLLNLVLEIVGKRVIDWKKVKRAAKIRYWLKALDVANFLTYQQRQQIIYKLIEISEINNFPTAPVLEERSRPAILVGEQGPAGQDGTDAGGTFFQNTDVDTSIETVDSFAIGLARGASWNYTIRDNAGTAARTGWISAVWLADGSTVNSGGEYSTAQIGDTSGVTLSVDFSGGLIRLRAVATTNNWIVEGARYTSS
jgi:hypothetical protein